MKLHENEALYALLQMAADPECRPSFFPFRLNDSEWENLHTECLRQLLVGVAYRAISHLPKDQQPSLEIIFQWASEAETIKGQNIMLNKETVRLTQLFAARERNTAVLKGPANAILYPDPFMRAGGDIDLWVDGGRESVVSLLRNMGFEFDSDDMLSEHHVNLRTGENKLSVEIHYKASSGNENPFTNKRLQKYLDQEIKKSQLAPEGFYVPPIKFALVMQLAHIQRHFLWEGIGLKQLTDYYILLRHSSSEDRHEVASKLKSLGLYASCGAVMWIMEYVFALEPEMMLVKPDKFRGKMLLDNINAGGNFGFNPKNKKQHHYVFEWFRSRFRNIRLFLFSPMEVVWHEIDYWKTFIRYIPLRIKLRRISVRNV